MKLMRLAACAVAFALVGGIVVGEDMDIKALQAKLAAQEARLNDLQAKMGSGSSETPASIISMRKNAKVTIGGSLDTRYYALDSEIEQDMGIKAVSATAKTTWDTAVNDYENSIKDSSAKATLETARGAYRDALIAAGATARTGRMARTFDSKQGRLYMDTAKLNVKIDINENMDAYLQMDLHDGARGPGNNGNLGMAQNYWVRWKNICNSGFGVLVGRDGVKFGAGKPIGTIDAFYQDYGPHTFVGTGSYGAGIADFTGEGMFLKGNMRPTHYGVGTSRTLQITPYWETQDGKFKAELSLFSRLDGRGDGSDVVGTVTHTDDDGDSTTYNRSINNGIGSASLRLTFKPTEDLTLTASAMNLRANYDDFTGYRGNDNAILGWPAATTNTNGDAKNDFVYSLSAVYNPAIFCKRLTVWGTFMHEFNAGWVQDLDVWSANAGIMYALTDKLKVFAQGDYMVADNDNGQVWAKGAGWRSYIGANYSLGSGADLEFGWVHDNFDYENAVGYKHTEFTSDLLYARLGFQF